MAEKMTRPLQGAARLLALAGFDMVAVLGEAFAVEELGMKLAPPKTKRIDGWINGRPVQVKSMIEGVNGFFGGFDYYETETGELIDFLFVRLQRSTFEIVDYKLVDAETLRPIIEGQSKAHNGTGAVKKLFLSVPAYRLMP